MPLRMVRPTARCWRWAVVFCLAWLACLTAGAEEPKLELKPGDHLCIVGNTLAERMQHFGGLETLLHSRFPQHQLVVRNLGYSGDEITLRLRSMDFGSPDQWLSANAPVPQPNKLREKPIVRENRFELTNTKADVIFAFFGYNESYAGEKGLPKFKGDLENWLKHTLSQKYNGQSAPRVVLFSPIAFENTKDPNLPNGEKHNPQLKLYTDAMREVAQKQQVVFVDLYTPTLAAYPQAKSPLTINGVHLNAQGDDVVAGIIDTSLFGPHPSGTGSAATEALRAAVNEKSFYWYHRYRTTDGFSTYGDRAFLKFTDGQSNYEVLQRELETLDLMTANRDARIWAVAQGKEPNGKDSNLPEFISVVTNKPGSLPGGLHSFLKGGEEAISKMTVGKGLKVTLFASEEDFPELINPVQMAFDAKGRLWVATWPTYPHWKPGEPMNDRLLILEDTNGDGKADKCKTFVDNLHNPTGFEFWNGGVLVGNCPDLLFLKDTNGDDVADVRNRVLHGLDTADTHHAANSFTLDPGGALYFQEGTFHHTQVETAWKPSARCANAGVFRYEPRAQKFDVYVSFGFANPHGHSFDHWGQDIVVDGTGAVPFHACLFSGNVDFPRKHGGPPTVYKQRTRPCPAIEYLYSSHFPEDFRGNLLVGNVIGFQGILRYKIEDKGASFAGTELEPLLSSSDPNFRPADIETAPDGSVYFTDWQNPIIGHMQHNLRDPSRDRLHGRVYRITHEGRDLVKPLPIAGEPVEKLLNALKDNDLRVRYRARLELSGRSTQEVIPATEKWLAGLDRNDANFEHHQLEALWVHQHHNVVNEDLLNRVLASKEYRARAAGTRVLCYWRDRVKDPLGSLQKLVNDEASRVRLEAIRALSFFYGEEAKRAIDIVTEALVHPDDEYIKYTFNETMNSLQDQQKK